MRLLGIETSCDETAVAIVSDQNGVEISLVSSQVDLHRPFGGVVPEVACRAHQEWLPRLVSQALSETGRERSDFDGVAVTHGPGLVGALLVGVSYAQALAWAWGCPLVGVNHLEAHLASLALSQPPFEPPYVGLVVSGGHTEYVLVEPDQPPQHLGGTLDDAAGEAFDKVAQILGLDYPGGPAIEKAASEHHGELFPFPVPMREHPGCDISFSGLKTAVAQTIAQQGDQHPVNYWAASFQNTVVTGLLNKLQRAVKSTRVKRVGLVGGVAANGALRDATVALGQRKGWQVGIVPRCYCGDNAAMVAMAALQQWSPTTPHHYVLDVNPNLFFLSDK